MTTRHWIRQRAGVCLLVLLLLLLVLPALAFADRVIPSSRVSTTLNVREAPRVDSAVVGQLGRNGSAEFVNSVPYWFEVRLDNGQSGFVSKVWSDRLVDAEQTGEIIRLGAWNIKKLGHGSHKDYPLVAQIIDANFDVLAVVEVMQKSHAHPGYEALMIALGNGWSGLITHSPRPNTGVGHAEFYAVIYRTAIVRPCAGWDHLVYHADNDGSGTSTDPNVFSREPAFACFEVPLNMATPGVDFMLAPYHALSQSSGGVTGVKSEVHELSAVFSSMAAAQAGEQDLFVMGDFNLTPAQLATQFSSGDRTEGSGSTLNNQGLITGNLFDHLLVHDEGASNELIGNAEVLDVRGRAANDATFFSTVSDHLPIRIRLRAFGPDDD